MKKLKLILVLLVILAVCSLSSCSGSNFDDSYFADMKAEDATKHAESNIRVMSSNVLVHMKNGWGGSKVAPRAEIFANAISHYRPDVVGVQEFCGCWYNELPKQIIEYELLYTKKSYYTNIIYNKTSVKLLEKGMFRYSKQSNRNCRMIIWGVFERIVGGEKFLVTSTHLDFGQEDKKVEMRNLQISELTKLISNISKEYNDCAIFSVGDFNFGDVTEKEGLEFYNRYLDVSKLSDAKFQKNIEKICGTGGAYEDETYDHIFINQKVQPKRFNVLTNDYYKTLSDHPIICLDAKI